MKKGISSSAKVGIFVCIILIILFWITFKISSGTMFGKVRGYTIKALFKNAQGLNTKTGIFIAGIKIGFVDSIHLQGDKALVTLRISPDIKIRKNAKAIIRTKGLLGEKYIEIIPGEKSAEDISPGGEMIFTESPPDFEKLMSRLNSIAGDIKSVSQNLKDVFGGAKGAYNIKELVNNLNKTIRHIDRFVISTNRHLNTTFSSLNGFAKVLKTQGPDILVNLARVSKELHEIIAENKQSVNVTMANINNASKKLDKTLANLEAITDNVKKGNGVIGKLLTDKKTEHEMSKAIRGLSTFVGGAARFKTIVSYRGEYQFKYNNVKSYLSLRLQPSKDKYYLLGIVDDPSGYSTTSTTYTSIKSNTGAPQQTETVTNNITERLKINAELAKRISYFTFRGGIIESTGGIGIDVHSPGNMARMSVEIFDFNKNPYPDLKAMLSISILRYFLLSGGMTDIADRDSRTWFLGVGLRFNDKDLKNIFGLAASASRM